MKMAIFIIILFILCFIVWPDDTITFIKTFDGSSVDQGRYVQQTKDGGYIKLVIQVRLVLVRVISIY